MLPESQAGIDWDQKRLWWSVRSHDRAAHCIRELRRNAMIQRLERSLAEL
jgi:hypothetical protein